jgi:stalled ribosome alternative rescue factor ArfA
LEKKRKNRSSFSRAACATWDKTMKEQTKNTTKIMILWLRY